MRERILETALEQFAEKGFHATSTRDIANRAPCAVSNIYNSFASKDEILLALLRRTAEALTSEVRTALAAVPDEPRVRLVAAVAAHVRFHASRQAESYVAAAELRSLTPPEREQYVRQRDEYEAIFGEILSDGVSTGEFLTAYPREATRAILAMATAVATWYRPDGDLSVEQVCGTYAALALATAQVVGSSEPDDDIRTVVAEIVTRCGQDLGVAVVGAVEA